MCAANGGWLDQLTKWGQTVILAWEGCVTQYVLALPLQKQQRLGAKAGQATLQLSKGAEC